MRAVCRSLRVPGTWRTNAHNVKPKSLCRDRPINELLQSSQSDRRASQSWYRGMIALRSHEEVRTDCGRWRDCKKIPATKPGFFSINGSALQLGSAALALVLVFFVLALAALLLLILLVLLVLLTGLAALLAGLTGLTALSTLLSVLIHVICHENSPPFKCASRRII